MILIKGKKRLCAVRSVAQPLQFTGRAVPTGMRLEANRRRRAWEWGARLGSYTIIDRQEWEMDFHEISVKIYILPTKEKLKGFY